MSEIIIGIDIGGTTIKIGFLNVNGEILEKWEITTNKSNAGNMIIDDICNAIENKLISNNLRKDAILGIGIGAPGFIDAKTGIVSEAVNIGWDNFDLAGILKAKTGLPVFVQNDANIAALGENWKGAGNRSSNLIAITLGTGVGGGVIVNGAILNGVNGMAGEIGHIKVEPNGTPCNCGGIGCLETISSATGIKRLGMERVAINPNSNLANVYHEKGRISARDIFDLAKNGDEICIQIVKRATDVLGLAIANMATIVNPSKILIGGGVSKAGDYLITEVTAAFEKYAIPKLREVCEIKAAGLGNDAGIIGGAYLVKQMLK